MLISLIRKFIPVNFAIIFLLSSFVGGQVIQNDVFWKDTDGNPIYSQGGGVIQVGDTWYWYGAHYRGAEIYYNDPTDKNEDWSLVSVSCYSSQDLANWTFEADVFTGNFGWFGRLGVVYHAGTGKYVLIAQEGASQVFFATSDSPTGTFTHVHTLTPPGVANGGTGDQTVFQDDDGKAYIICSSRNGRSNWYVIPLRESDFLGMEQAVRIGGGAGREGNCMFKYRGRYYFNSSLLHGWNTSPTYFISATNILGPYSQEKVMINTAFDYSHVTQTGFFIEVKGTQDTTIIFAGDRWADFAANGIGYNQWVPLSFDGIDPIFNSHSEWSLNAVTGKWRVGQNNNFILNPAIEADRTGVGSVVGWEGSDPNVGDSPYSGDFSLDIGSGRTASQQIPAGPYIDDLADGTYEMKAWIKSNGGGNCQISISGFGGSTMNQSASAGSWTEIRISGINISSGQATVRASNTGSGSCRMDDFSLVRTDPVPVTQRAGRSDGEFAFNPAAQSVRAYGLAGMTILMEIYTVNGKKILEQILVPASDAAQFKLPADRLQKGRYLLKMISDGNTRVLNITMGK